MNNVFCSNILYNKILDLFLKFIINLYKKNRLFKILDSSEKLLRKINYQTYSYHKGKLQ